MTDATQSNDSTREPSSIVVPWDFSDHAKAALKYARRRFADRQIHIVCVLETPNPFAFGLRWDEDAEETAASHCAGDFSANSGFRKATEIDFQTRFGEPAEEIVTFANQQQAEFIVMSTHGRTGVQKLVMGSVAQKVIAHAKCPVIMLPAHWYKSQKSN